MKNLQQLFNIVIKSAGTRKAQVSAMDCFDLVSIIVCTMMSWYIVFE